MLRLVIDDLRKWKESPRRKPLILKGARQVGKTWILKEFGKDFKDGYLYINFDKDIEYHQFFIQTKDVKRILTNLSMACGKKITTDMLIIFDEIQACPEALNTLKYFYEDAPEYYIACACSLLGLTLVDGFPVGKVNFMTMGPMTFEEFLLANHDDNLVSYLKSINTIEAIPDAFFNPLIEKLKMYFIVGGMPEPVALWSQSHDKNEVDAALEEILESYESDFGKHVPPTDIPKIRLIWHSLPSQLSKENKKFLYSVIKTGARAREYENALNRLINADLVKKVSLISKPGLPLSSYENLNAFKIYMNDVGLLRKHARLSSSLFMEENGLFSEFKGALSENFVLESLLNQKEIIPSYWANVPHEVDFIIQNANMIFPIEVKGGTNVEAASIKQYLKNYPETPFGIRLSLKNLSFDGKILNLPLFLVDELPRIINLIMTNQGVN